MNQIQDYIHTDYKAIRLSEDLASVQDFFDEMGFSHFPVADDMQFVGSLNADDASTFDAEKSVADYRYILEQFHAKTTMSWFEVFEVATKNHATIVPVLDEQNQYIGYYELEDILLFFHDTPLIKEAGSLLVIQKGLQDYSLTQITQIVESNNGKLLGLFVSATSNNHIEITLKLALGPLNEIIQTFRRYNYEIVSQHLEDQYITNLKERSDYLDKYLNI
ncbi:MAG: acetoin utilization protein acuB [Flavobacterium sp.]|jgi:Mg/Co/Ni transporter MgtE|nr:acetoin utilization protein acuB [Flavobacterium sp.]